MKNKKKPIKITFNMGLKIISLFFAFVLWLVVNNIDNPTVSRSYSNIPVKLLNTEMITDSGQVYEVVDGTDVVDRVTVWAPRSVISSLSERNITAIADVNDLSSLDTISIKFSTNLYTSQIEQIKGSIDNVKLHIENNRTKTLALKASTTGQVSEGYIVGDMTTDQNLVRISGPESVVSQISRAEVEVDVTGFTSDIVTNAEVKLYDQEDHPVEDSRIVQNINSIGVSVAIYQTKEVPFSFDTMGSPAQGYGVSGEITSNPPTVTLAGKSSVLKNISFLEIPEELLNITGASENYVTEIDIRDYLPDGVYLADSSQAKITVTVHIQQEISKRMEIREERVFVTNVPEGYRASISELGESFIIEVIGLPAKVAGLNASELEGRIDIAAWMEQEGMTEPVEGYYQLEVDFGLPEDVTILEPVIVTMHLSLMEIEEEQ